LKGHATIGGVTAGHIQGRDVASLPQTTEFLGRDRPGLVVDRDLVIRSANKALLTVAQREAEELISVPIFEAFPVNPDEPDGGEGVAAFTSSFEQVLRRERRHDLVIQRYDIPDATRPGRFLTRYWAPSNSPLRDGDAVVGVALQTREIQAPPPDALATLNRCRDILLGDHGLDDEATQQLVDALVWGMEEYDALGRKVTNLQRALVSRATIDQAKGIVMAERRCDPETAFRAMVQMSNESNVPLAQIAQALVYRVAGGTDPLAEAAPADAVPGETADPA
jgi:hypothetical protein